MAGVRLPAVAGAFYESIPDHLRASIEACFLHRLGPKEIPVVATTGPRRIIGLVCPHAGFQYSGPAAAWSYDALAKDGSPESVVILGTNHRLTGARAALSEASSWITPLGRMNLDTALCAKLRASGLLEEDELAHESEHSIEVQLPWLQFLYKEPPLICPILLGHLHLPAIHEIGQLLIEAIGSREVVIIASSDFSHYVPREVAQRLDRLAIEAILNLEAKALFEVVEDQMISMCGVIPVAILLEACKGLGGAKAELLSYYTSGEISGDSNAVVGYASIAIQRQG